MQDLIKYTDNINKLLARFGVKFGIYKNNVFHEQLFPFDAIPRVITAKEFEEMERGLVQRVTALNMFLYDIYHEQKIIKDKIIPEEFVFSSKGYLPECAGVTPPGNVYSHISGIDLSPDSFVFLGGKISLHYFQSPQHICHIYLNHFSSSLS